MRLEDRECFHNLIIAGEVLTLFFILRLGAMLTEEELQRAFRQLVFLRVSKDPGEVVWRTLQTINNKYSSHASFWSKVWEHYHVKEVDMIAIYRKQKTSFQKVFDAMMHRMHVLKKVFPPEETEFIRELETLLSVDDLLLNSTHVVLILRAMKFLKDKRNEGTKTGGQTSAIDRHRYIGLHLVILLQFRHVLEATSLQGSVLLNSIQSITLKLQQLAEKYKPMLDHDQPEKARVETTLHILNFTSSRSEALLASNSAGAIDVQCLCDILSIVNDAILVQRSAVLEKSSDPSKGRILLPFPPDVSEDETTALNQLLDKLTNGTKDAATESVVENTLDNDDDDDSDFLCGVDFGGFLSF